MRNKFESYRGYSRDLIMSTKIFYRFSALAHFLVATSFVWLWFIFPSLIFLFTAILSIIAGVIALKTKSEPVIPITGLMLFLWAFLFCVGTTQLLNGFIPILVIFIAAGIVGTYSHALKFGELIRSKKE